MKKKYAILLLSIVAFLSSCKKDPIISNDKRVGISRITYYADITVAGDQVISIPVGENFIDPGVKATAGGQDVPVKTTGTVDNSKAGLYILYYSATNADGYTSSASRIIVVTPGTETAGVDISGSYSAVPVGTTPGPATITKVASGVYYTSNCWGNSGAVIPAYFICLDGSTILVPNQSSPYGALESSTPGSYSNGLITWSIDLIDQGGLIRVKKWQKL